MKNHTKIFSIRAVRKRSRLSAAILLIACGGALAANGDVFDIASGPAGLSLMKLADAANVQISIPEKEGRNILLPALKGEYTLRDALDYVLAGTNLIYEFTSDDAIVVMAAENSSSESDNKLKDNSQELEEIIVTASRRAESLQDVAISMSVINTEDFANAGKTGLADILPYVPGVSVTNGGGSAFFNAVVIRGVNAFSSGGVGNYIDDIPYGSQTTYSGGGAPIDATLLDLEGLEVLKGPQGTLYGASAMGGLLKFKTKDPSLEKWSGNVSVDLSQTSELGGFNHLHRVSANGPLIDGLLGASVTLFRSERDGFIDNITIPKSNWDGYKYHGGSGSLLFTPTENLTIKATALYQKSTQEGLSQIQVNGSGPSIGQPIAGNFQTAESAANPSIFETTVYGLTAEYDLGFATLTSITSSQDMSFPQSLDLTVPWAGFADLFFPENAPHTSALFVGEFGWEKVSQELRITSQSNQQFEWLAGVFYQDETGSNVQDLLITPAEPTLFYASFPSDYNELSLYATGTYYFTPKFDMSLGYRYSDYENKVEFDTRDTILLASFPPNTISDKVSTYLLNARYRPTDDMSIYTRIASGFRPGGANLLLVDQDGNLLVDPFVKPDELWSYELGIKGAAMDGRLSYDLSAFYIDWTDYQISVIIAGLGVSGNASKAEIKGFESALTFSVTDALSLSTTLSYVNAELGNDEPNLGGSEGTRIPDSPDWSGSVRLTYDYTLGSLPAFVSGSWSYTGSYPVGFPGFTDSNGTFFGPSQPRTAVDSYSTVDLQAGFSTDHYEVSLYATNLLNKYAYEYLRTANAGTGFAFPLRPRTIGVRFKANFN